MGRSRRDVLGILSQQQQRTPRHRLILKEALKLFSARGYAGASLRALARQVGMSQPSLYHYFKTKEDLAEQVLLFYGAELLLKPGVADFPTQLQQVPRFLAAYAVRLWDDPEYVALVRFMFAVAPTQPRLADAARTLYDRSRVAMTPLLLQPLLATGELSQSEAENLVRLVLNAVALTFIERRVLYGEKRNRADGRELARWVGEFVAAALPNALVPASRKPVRNR